ncbi:MAG: 1-phosphofructokinase family hexose kinase [Eubacteriales bacterium]|jgi:1-phosphofructokinase
MSIYTLTLNPALDVSVRGAGAACWGKLNKTDSQTLSCGGKGINVSRALKAMGEDAPAYLFYGGETGRTMLGMLDAEGIEYRGVETSAPTRINVKTIFGTNGGTVLSEFNGAGGPISREELEKLCESLMGELKKHTINPQDSRSFLIMSGSIPQGVENTVYNSVIMLLKNRGVHIVVDASGAALESALEASPYMIKPNLDELSSIAGKRLVEMSEILYRIFQIFVENGTRVLATLSEKGAIYAGPEGLWKVSSPQVELKSFAGAGDTFLAGFVHTIGSGEAGSVSAGRIPDALKFASSAAAAKVELDGTEIPTLEQMGKYLGEITVERLKI